MTPAFAAIVFVAAGAVLYIAGSIVRRLHRLPTPAAEIHAAPTDDGWNLAVYRYGPPDGAPRRAAEPVILCHGMLSNRFSVDLDEDRSLARYLGDEGFDVWVMELRGHGNSRRARTGGWRPFDWTVDDYVRRDLPAVIDYVRRRTGASHVHWVGHSLGGMILYAACALGLTSAVRSAVMGDVPVSFWQDHRVGWFGRAWVRFVPVIPPRHVIPFTLLVALLSPSRLLPKYGITSRRTMLRIVSNGIIDYGCSRAGRQLADMVLRRRFASADGAIDYEAGVDRIHFPILQLAAARRGSPEAVVKSLIDRAPVEDKTYLRVGREAGFSEDFTHFTLFLGDRARREVYPVVADFLARRSTPPQPPARAAVSRATTPA